MKKLFVAAALMLSSTSFASECFDANFVHGWNYDHFSEVINLQYVGGDLEVKTTPFCRELPFANKIAFKSFGGGSFICAGDDVVVLDGFDRPQELCRIENIKRK